MSVTVYIDVFCEKNVFFSTFSRIIFRKSENSENALLKITRDVYDINLLGKNFWDVYDVNLLGKKFGRSMAYSWRTNAFKPFLTDKTLWNIKWKQIQIKSFWKFCDTKWKPEI